MQMIVEIAQEELLITPDLGTPVSPRNTKRKTLIREVLNAEYGGAPVLLEELRWKVFLKETADDPTVVEMTVSYQKSFARTLRDHLGLVHNGVTVHKPDAQAKDTDIRKNTSRNKRRREWL